MAIVMTSEAVAGTCTRSVGDRLAFLGSAGSDDAVNVGALAGVFDAINFTFECTFICTDITVTGILFELAQDVNNRITVYHNAASLNFFVNVAGVGTNVNFGNIERFRPYDLRVVVDRAGNATMYLDGVQFGAATSVAASAGDINASAGFIGRNAFATTAFFQGTIFDVRLYNASSTLIHEWEGYGNVDADWLDIVGTADGTVEGTPIKYYVYDCA